MDVEVRGLVLSICVLVMCARAATVRLYIINFQLYERLWPELYMFHGSWIKLEREKIADR